MGHIFFFGGGGVLTNLYYNISAVFSSMRYQTEKIIVYCHLNYGNDALTSLDCHNDLSSVNLRTITYWVKALH